jgi:hypothetical protein
MRHVTEDGSESMLKLYDFRLTGGERIKTFNYEYGFIWLMIMIDTWKLNTDPYLFGYKTPNPD